VADDERPAVGTVAEEAARLLDALGGWASSAQAGYAARPTTEHDDADRDGQHDDGQHDDGQLHDHAHGTGAPGTDRPGAAAGGSRCATCGAENGVGQAVACQLCPVCQGIGLLRSVRPETVDRLADLAGALAATLRDMAGQRRAASGSSASRSSQPPSSRVQDIVVDDEDTHGSATS
jgi:hypothetical protein